MSPGTLAALALSVASLSGAASAQTPPPATPTPAPRFLTGFTHPDITECKTVNANRRECTIPANVGGSYLIEAAGFANSTAPDATLVMNIIVGQQICIMQTSNKFTGPAYLHLICEVTLATDAPVTVAVNLATRGATLNADGPKIAISSLPWDGVVSIRGSDAGALPTQPAPTPAPAAGTKPPAKPTAKPGH